MNDLIVELGLVAIGAVVTWLVILASQWSRRPRLRVCLDRAEVPRELTAAGGVYDRDVVLTVRNVGLGPAVDCVGRLERVEYLADGEWKEAHYTAADLEWRGTGGARTATIPSDAPPRHLRLFHLSKYFDRPLGGRVCYADPSDAPPMPPGLEHEAGLSGPNRFRFTVWVQPEGEAGASDSCTVEVDWRKTSEEEFVSDRIAVEADPACREKPDRTERLIGLLTRRVPG